MFFSMLFWAFFEQAGSSVNNFTDRNVDRVIETRAATPATLARAVEMRVPVQTTDEQLAGLPLLHQEQLGRHNGEAPAVHVDRARWAARARPRDAPVRDRQCSGR